MNINADGDTCFSQLLSLETHDMLECYSAAYSFQRFKTELQKQLVDGKPKKVAKVETFDFKKRELKDTLSIPSSFSVMSMEVLATKQEKSRLKRSKLESVTIDLKQSILEGPLLYD